jgi:hypothetical protein
MMVKNLLWLLLCLPAASIGQTIPSGAAIDAQVKKVMSNTHANGMAVAVVDKGKVGSMDTTISDLPKFAAALVSGDGLTAASRAEMTKPQLHITTAHQFPTFGPELPGKEQRKDLAAGLGVVVFDGPQGHGFLKGGHDGQTANTMVRLKAHSTSSRPLWVGRVPHVRLTCPGLPRGVHGPKTECFQCSYSTCNDSCFSRSLVGEV